VDTVTANPLVTRTREELVQPAIVSQATSSRPRTLARLNSEQVVDMFLRDTVVILGTPSGPSGVIPMSTHLPTDAPRTAQPRRLSRLDSEQAVHLYLMDTSPSLAASPLSGASEPPATDADASEPLAGPSSEPAPTDLLPAVPAHPRPPEDVRSIP